LEQANQAIGRLDGLASVLPDVSLFIYTYVRKEAVLSSQIEGTQSSLSDLLLFENEEAPGVPVEDVQEVSNYVAAMNHGLERIRSGFPLSLRLIREIHEILLSKGRGSGKQPGEFRQSQNWIGGSRPGNAPTGCSWLNMVERFFRDLTENQLRRGVFHSVEELIAAIDQYIDRHNESPKPFIWTAKAADILEKVKRARAVLNLQSA
jgi:Fic family protein